MCRNGTQVGMEPGSAVVKTERQKLSASSTSRAILLLLEYRNKEKQAAQGSLMYDSTLSTSSPTQHEFAIKKCYSQKLNAI